MILLHSWPPYSPLLLANLIQSQPSYIRILHFFFTLGHPNRLCSWPPYSPFISATLFSFTLDHPILLHPWPPYSLLFAIVSSFTLGVASSALGHPILCPPLPPNGIAVAVLVDLGTLHSWPCNADDGCCCGLCTIGNRQIGNKPMFGK